VRRKLALVLLGLGSVFGFALGVHSLRHPHEHGWRHRWGWHESHMDRVADACVRAAERVRQPGGSPQSAPAP
jgi:hypothetical protein